jgi:antitoxin component YwqK of YwqJK toxin-antitoxin module
MKFILIFLLSVSAFSQNFNQFDEQGKKNGLWKGFYEVSKRQRYEGTFEHGVEKGVFTFFDDTAKKDVIATRTFSENGAVCYTIFFDQNKNVVSEGKSVNKLQEGEWKYYHKNSKEIQTLEIYKKGKLNGNRKVFYAGNILAEESDYVDGKREGKRKIYTIKGIVIEETNYKNDMYQGWAIFRNPDGNIDSQGNFVNNEKKGKWQFFIKGKLKKEEIYPKRIKFKKTIRKNL